MQHWTDRLTSTERDWTDTSQAQASPVIGLLASMSCTQANILFTVHTTYRAVGGWLHHYLLDGWEACIRLESQDGLEMVKMVAFRNAHVYAATTTS